MSGSALRPPFRYAPLRPKGRKEERKTLNLKCPVKGNHLNTSYLTAKDGKVIHQINIANILNIECPTSDL